MSPGKVPKLDALGRAGSPDKAGQGLQGRVGSSRPFRVLDRNDQGLLTGQRLRTGHGPYTGLDGVSELNWIPGGQSPQGQVGSPRPFRVPRQGWAGSAGRDGFPRIVRRSGHLRPKGQTTYLDLQDNH